MNEPGYRIDEEGNLVEDRTATEGAKRNGSDPADEPPLSLEQARATTRALVSSEVLGVLLLLGGAVYYEDQRALLLGVAAVYAVFAFFAARYLKRSLYKRVEGGSPG